MHKPKRKRKATNLTLSETARVMGDALAESRGMRFSQLVEQLIRRELARAGKLPADASYDLIAESGDTAATFIEAKAAAEKKAPARKRAA